MSEIVIDLKGVSKAKTFNNDELLQKDRFEDLSYILEKMIKEIKCEKSCSIEECRVHDAILIDGERGSGKTSFLINIENFLKKNHKDLFQKLKFFKPIDPTLLEDSERFITIIVARIVEEVNREFSTNRYNEDLNNLKKEFFNVINEVSESLASIKTVKDDIGIDEIASYASSIKLENNLHKFFEVVTKIFDVEKLIILIDDVDMAFDKGVYVLEDIRKYLSSPYIIPIVAGDYDLYKDILQNFFRKKFRAYKDEINNYLQDKINNLTNQYLHKVFPSEFRIELKDLESILKENIVKFKINNNNEFTFKELKTFEKKSLNIGINRESEQFCPLDYNIRLFLKYFFTKREVFEQLADMIKESDEVDINRLKESFEITSRFYKYSMKEDKLLFSQLLENDANSFIKTSDSFHYNLYIAFNGEFFEKNKIKNPKKYFINADKSKSKIKEFIDEEKDKDKIKEPDTIDIRKYIIPLFSHVDYKDYQRYFYIVVDKFLKLITLSLSLQENIQIDKFSINISEQKWIDELFEKMKQYKQEENNFIENLDISVSENALNELEKIIFYQNILFETDNKKDSKPEIYEDDLLIDVDKQMLESLYKRILFWKENFISKNFLSSVSLYKIQQKFFENIQSLKNVKIKENNNNYIIALKRYMLMFINSVAIYENSSFKATNQNIALSEKFDLEKVLIKTISSTLNIKPLVVTEKDTLTKALFFHPIIREILLADNIFQENEQDDPLIEFLKEKNKIDLLEEITNKKFMRGDLKIKILDFLIEEIKEDSIDKIKHLVDNSYIMRNKVLKAGSNENLKNKIKELKEKLKEK